jgi:hypothetical protein
VKMSAVVPRQFSQTVSLNGFSSISSARSSRVVSSFLELSRVFSRFLESFRAPSGLETAFSSAQVNSKRLIISSAQWLPEQLFRAHSGSGAAVSSAKRLRSSCFDRPVAPALNSNVFKAPSDHEAHEAL